VRAIDLQRAARLWDGQAGLHPIDLTVEAGELVVVRGRSGSGKSTLLALVAGLCQPGSGSVLVLGSRPAVDTPWADVAIVPQVLALSTELSIGENIADCAQDAANERVAELLRRLDVIELADRTISEVSMGQQQRAAVARAMVADPRVLLADEPTSYQDDGHTGVVVDALRHAAARASAVLVATHDDTVAAAADRVIELTSSG
jgi:putative ABC transport system ATP-binding protein